MQSASGVPQPIPPSRDDAPDDVDRPLVVRIYGELKHRIVKYGNRRGLSRSSVVKSLTAKSLEKEGF